jgi:hypothetical protein
VRFINRDNFIISHRYSISVNQYSQSVDAYNYYETLKSFSASESIFSEVQPGFLEGNISATGSENRTVLGYFEVASVSNQRLFFDYADLFPGEPLPEFPITCVTTLRNESHGSNCDPRGRSPGPLSLIEAINLGLVAYSSEEQRSFEDGSRYSLWNTVNRACGDCTLFGSDEIPDFWIE